MSVYRWFAILATSALLAVLVVGGLAVEHASGASPGQPMASDEANTCSGNMAATLTTDAACTTETAKPRLCTGTITGSLSPNTIRSCDTSEVTVRTEAECPFCYEGVFLMFVRHCNQFEVDGGNWMVRMGDNVLEALEEFRDETGTPVRAGVVQYEWQRRTLGRRG